MMMDGLKMVNAVSNVAQESNLSNEHVVVLVVMDLIGSKNPAIHIVVS